MSLANNQLMCVCVEAQPFDFHNATHFWSLLDVKLGCVNEHVAA